MDVAADAETFCADVWLTGDAPDAAAGWLGAAPVVLGTW